MLKALVVKTDEPSQRVVPLDADSITIGRATTNTLSFPTEQALSRQHALIQRSGDDWILADLGSRNGTLLNGSLVKGQVELSDGDRIEIGGVTIVCTGDPQASPTPSSSPPASPPRAAGGAELIFPGRSRTFTITDPTPFSYGRSSVLFRTEVGGQDVCVKLFSTVQGADWENVAAFEREVLAQTHLQHPNILPIVDYGLHSKPHGSPFVVLPFCQGGTFRVLLRERAFYRVSGVLSQLEQVAAALDFAHASGFVHGDVKPENVLLSEDRKTALLSDFGMSNVFAIQERFSTVVAGPQGGTTAYLSPEQIAESQQTPLSDIYSFAMTAYELLTGRLPFDRNLPTFRQMLAKVKGELIDPLLFNPAIGDRAKAALMAGLAREPLARPRSASEFCRLLAETTPASTGAASASGRSVFVSYSHRDAEWLERVRVHLRPLERQGRVTLWDDTRIQPGSNWREQIRQALEGASAAILLISSHFLASDFCANEELPHLLTSAAGRGVRILPVIVSPCQLNATPLLAALQAVNPPTRTLIEMDRGEQERVLVMLANAVWHDVMGS